MATLRTNYQEGEYLYASDMNETNAEVNKKVAKEDGKGLSSNDYTNVDKSKVATALQPAALNLYRTSQAQDAIDKDKVSKIPGKDLSTNDYSNAEKEKVTETDNKTKWLSIVDGKICITHKKEV